MDDLVLHEIRLHLLFLVDETAGVSSLCSLIRPLFDLRVRCGYLFPEMSPVFAGKAQSIYSERILGVVSEIVEREMGSEKLADEDVEDAL